MPWTVLLFAAGSLAIPAPAIFLVPPYPKSQEDPIHISCTAPKDFLGVNFTLYREGQIVQLLQAPANQLGVTFNLSGGGAASGGKFWCQYSVVGEHSQPQLSDLSQPVHVSFPVPTWILALSLSLAGALLLLTGLAAFAVVVRRVKIKNLQRKREQESCWAQINFTTADMSFDNSLFAVSAGKLKQRGLSHSTKFTLPRSDRTGIWTPALRSSTQQGGTLENRRPGQEEQVPEAQKMTSEEDPAATLDACAGNCGPRKRPTSTSSSPEPPEFSTFRACQ
ncbi:protein HIDE1 isoform X2 [Marmota monax]|uniref:protein HIDE1 isoform X2 n=1 Tax=Marmota monax TaxID=9995 RepID=UPI001EB022FD|nr:protein HIDE1 isoform X2 [Marmota monax]